MNGSKLKLEQKRTNKGPRWFANTNDGFDGTAQGYGYKSPDAVNRAYWYFKNQNKLADDSYKAGNFLTDNLDIKIALEDYIKKCPQNISMDEFIQECLNFTDKNDIVQRILKIKPLWKSIIYELSNKKANNKNEDSFFKNIKAPENSKLELVDVYVDGSFKSDIGKAAWAFIIVKNKEVWFEDKGILEGEINSMWQVGGEIKSVIKALEYCSYHNFRARVNFDLLNLMKWVADLFGFQPWQTKNEWSKMYRKTVFEYKDYIDSFIKIKSHSGDKFNEMVHDLVNSVYK